MFLWFEKNIAVAVDQVGDTAGDTLMMLAECKQLVKTMYSVASAQSVAANHYAKPCCLLYRYQYVVII